MGRLDIFRIFDCTPWELRERPPILEITLRLHFEATLLRHGCIPSITEIRNNTSNENFDLTYSMPCKESNTGQRTPEWRIGILRDHVKPYRRQSRRRSGRADVSRVNMSNKRNIHIRRGRQQSSKI